MEAMRRLFLLTLPGLVVGFIAGVFAGGLTAFLRRPTGAAVVAALSLGVPLALLGGGYTMLLINDRVRLGGFAPAALFWLIGFPVARLLHELAVTWYVGGTPPLPPGTGGVLPFPGGRAGPGGERGGRACPRAPQTGRGRWRRKGRGGGGGGASTAPLARRRTGS